MSLPMITRCDGDPPGPARGGTIIDLRALIATVDDALIASFGKFTMKAGLPGSGAFTKIECSPARVPVGAPSPSPMALILRGTPVLPGCFGAVAAAEAKFLPARPSTGSPLLATAFPWPFA